MEVIGAIASYVGIMQGYPSFDVDDFGICSKDCNSQSLEEEEVQQQSSRGDTLSPPLTPETPPLGPVKWTDQGERLKNLRREYVQQSPRQKTSTDVVGRDTVRQVSQDTSSNDSNAAVSRQANSLTGSSDSDAVTAGNKSYEVDIYQSFRVSMEDPCSKVLPAALRKHNITAPWETYALYIVYGDKERCLGMEEKPLRIIKALEKEGWRPMFMLRKINPSENSTSIRGK
ncbi:hypothetical protein BDZ45DRAFT_691088 [Acephala macrosclerotiorum]|nr:hypothetical protein BDZ45DRAFT_691088 [Acephala macrosclerotiorum]